MRYTLPAIVLIGLGTGCPLLAAEDGQQTVQTIDTQRMDFPAGGILRLNDSIGEVTITAWDQPAMELTTTKATKFDLTPRERKRATAALASLRVTAQRQGEEIVITTEVPRGRIWPLPSRLGGARAFYVTYDIKVPRTARLIVNHDIGEVHIDDIAGDIRVSAPRGTVVLRLPETRQYAIDASSDWGSVTSDFPGREKRHWWLIGHQFLQSSSSGVAAQKLNLHVGYGDVLILHIDVPPLPGPLASAAKPNGL